MRKLFILCTTFLLVCGLFTPNLTTYANDNQEFLDIGTSHRAQKEIYYLAAGEIANGSLDGRFYPDRYVTRAEAAAMIGRSLDLNGTKRATDFYDVGSNQFASGYIQSAVENKIISGYSDGSFKPNQFVTRGEMAILINRAFKYGATTASSSARALMEKGIALGMADGTFGLDLHIKRADFSVFLARALNPELRINDKALSVIRQTTVTVNSLNVRKGPLVNYDSISQLNKGTIVGIIERIGNWAYVKVNGMKGFVHAGYLSGEETVTPVEPETPSEEPTSSLNEYIKSQTIVIDAGHGGSDPGAVANGLREADVTLAVSLKLQSLFKGTGFNIAMTRESDVYPTLSERVAFAKKVGGDIFISIHANSAGSSASGTESYYYKAAATNPYVADSQKLATYIQKRLVAAWGLSDRGVKIGDLYVLRENNMPATLLELGFITNKGDAYKLNSSEYQYRAAKAIYLGILDYYQAKTGFDFSALYDRF